MYHDWVFCAINIITLLDVTSLCFGNRMKSPPESCCSPVVVNTQSDVCSHRLGTGGSRILHKYGLLRKHNCERSSTVTKTSFVSRHWRTQSDLTVFPFVSHSTFFIHFFQTKVDEEQMFGLWREDTKISGL